MSRNEAAGMAAIRMCLKFAKCRLTRGTPEISKRGKSHAPTLVVSKLEPTRSQRTICTTSCARGERYPVCSGNNELSTERKGTPPFVDRQVRYSLGLDRYRKVIIRRADVANADLKSHNRLALLHIGNSRRLNIKLQGKDRRWRWENRWTMTRSPD